MNSWIIKVDELKLLLFKIEKRRREAEANRSGFYLPTYVFVRQQISAKARGPFLTSTLGANFDPQGRSCPPGVNFVP
jgi:hypothetical protein